MSHRRVAAKLLLVAVILGIHVVASTAPHRSGGASEADRVGWLGADGQPLPFETPAEILQFLRDAEIVSSEPIPTGVTHPRKMLLELDGTRAHAIFRDIDVSKTRVKLQDGSFHMKFRDYFLFEVAAYRMATLLGLDNVPPTVVRRIAGKQGSLQLWIENVISTGGPENELRPPSYSDWAAQVQAVGVFDYLILNIDRNSGNYLVDADWKLWIIDHTRAFQVTETVPSPESIVRCERRLWERLQALDAATVRETVGPLLTPGEISRLLERLDSLRTHVLELIIERGERAVIS